MTRSLRMGACLAAALAMSGCEFFAARPQALPVAVPVADPAAARLAEAARVSAEAYQRLARLQASRLRPTPTAPAEVPPALAHRVTLSWLGPVEGVVRHLADNAGWSLEVSGPTPRTPVMVTVAAREERIVDVLREVGAQTARRALLVVDADRATLRLIYPETS